MEQTGIFLKAGEVKTFDSGFKVQEFYLDCRTYNQFTGEPIENLLKFQVSGEKISLLNGVKKVIWLRFILISKGSYTKRKMEQKDMVKI